MNLGQFIKQKRKNKNMTMEQLGKAIGKNKVFIHRLENNKVKTLKDDTIVPLANALNIPVMALFDGWDFNGNQIENEQTTQEEFEQEVYTLLSKHAQIKYNYSTWLTLSYKLLNNVIDLDDNQKKTNYILFKII